MENKGKQKNNPRDDMSLDQAILQWIVDDYDIPDEKSRKIVGESGEKSKLITCKMVMDYLDNRGVVEETDETEFMRALRKRLYYAIDTVVGPIPMKSKSINAHELLRQKNQAKGRFHVTSANAEFFMYLLWCNEDRADNDDILWLIKNERSYEASEWLKNLVRDGFNSLVANSAIGIKQKTIERRWKELFEGELYKTKEAFESLKLTWSYIEDRKKIAGDEFDKKWFDLRVEKKLTPDIKQSFEHLQKDVSVREKMGSSVAKSFEKLEPGTHYNDSGAPYRMEQDLLSDAEYKRNGYEYTTDHLGRLFTAEGNLHLKEHDGRLQIKDNIHDIGKGYEKSTDDRGHAIADRFDGANDLENLVPQDAGLNRNEFKNFESKLAQELEAGKQVHLKLEMHYPGDSFRPDAITAETTIDGKQEVKVFLNDKY